MDAASRRPSDNSAGPSKVADGGQAWAWARFYGGSVRRLL
jgi:hypothetical protein